MIQEYCQWFPLPCLFLTLWERHVHCFGRLQVVTQPAYWKRLIVMPLGLLCSMAFRPTADSSWRQGLFFSTPWFWFSHVIGRKWTFLRPAGVHSEHSRYWLVRLSWRYCSWQHVRPSWSFTNPVLSSGCTFFARLDGTIAMSDDSAKLRLNGCSSWFYRFCSPVRNVSHSKIGLASWPWIWVCCTVCCRFASCREQWRTHGCVDARVASTLFSSSKVMSSRKIHLDNARKLRGIYFIDPEDTEFIETIKNARKKLETSVAPAVHCKIRKNNNSSLPSQFTLIAIKTEIARSVNGPKL